MMFHEKIYETQKSLLVQSFKILAEDIWKLMLGIYINRVFLLTNSIFFLLVTILGLL